jgi:hypothetical protein
MTHYLLSIEQPDGPPPPPEVFDPIMKRVAAFNDELKASNAWVFTGGLHDASSATVVRTADAQRVTTDGPYLEGKEHVGGFVVIKVADLDAALVWAEKLSRATTLPIEVRPLSFVALASHA